MKRAGGVVVQVITADTFAAEQHNLRPNVIKIDVEGYEENVLRGGSQVFDSSACRHILVEMHFSRMDKRNLGKSATRIVAMLKKGGYRVRWVDASHIHASR